MKRSKFGLSYYNLLSCDMGELIPCGLTEVLPGDSFQHATSALVRVSPLLAPVMHPVRVRIHHWFVPFRLLWDDWEDFITGGPDGMDASTFPTRTFSTGPVTGTLADYLGVPPGVNDVTVSALPFRAYGLIFNEFYRDQDLVSAVTVSTASGNDTTTSVTLQNAAWEKDYFTSARPWTQKGPTISIPLTGDAPVTGIGKDSQTFSQANETVWETGGTSSVVYASAADVNQAGGANTSFTVEQDPDNPGFPGIFADLSGVSAADINELRLAFALQRYEEARARWGSRYTEYLRYLGVRSSDARLQRPEYLGGGRQTIQFSEVLQTGVTTDADDTVGVGNLKGHGISAVRSNRYRRFFEEHGYIVTMLSVLPKTIYVQGLPRTWNRRTKEDFWQRELEGVGQQGIENRELFLTPDTPVTAFTASTQAPTFTWGYQDRYDEYRRQESRVSGEFRGTALDFWHMARIFASQPTLNSSFVTSNPTKRIHAVSSEDVLWIMCNHSIQARRMVAKTGKSFIF